MSEPETIYRLTPHRYDTKNCGKYNIKWQKCIVDGKPSTICDIFFDSYLECIKQKWMKQTLESKTPIFTSISHENPPPT